MSRWLFIMCNAVWIAQTLMALEASDVLVVANNTIGASKEIANAYCAARTIPTNHLLLLNLPDTGTVGRRVYRDVIEAPVLAAVQRLQTRCVVLCYGVPWRVGGRDAAAGNPLSTTWASVDSELASKGRSGSAGVHATPNPYFRSVYPFQRDDMLLVARLDGASPRDVLMLIARSRIAAAALDACAVIDVQPVVNGSIGGTVAAYNAALTRAAAWLRQQGLRVFLDTEQALAPPPAAPVALYWGWYAGPNGDAPTNTYTDFTWAYGAVGVHVCSFGAAGMRRDTSAAPALVRAGVSATIGTVYEPLVEGWPRPDIFCRAFVRSDGTGLTFIEAAYAATPYLSWQTVYIGDPLLTYTSSAGLQPSNLPALLAEASDDYLSPSHGAYLKNAAGLAVKL